MEQYISKSALLAEIEWLVNNYDEALDYEAALEDVRNFLDTLEVIEVDLQGEPQVKESAEIQHVNETCKENGNSLTQEPVSEELMDATNNYCVNVRKGYPRVMDEIDRYICNAFKSGAKWQAEQFEKNRLAACDRQAEEEAEIERDFVMGIIENEHRQPTFDDAIKYGMRLQKEQMMAKAIDGEIGYWNLRGLSINVDLPRTLKEDDRVKLIIIKQD